MRPDPNCDVKTGAETRTLLVLDGLTIMGWGRPEAKVAKHSLLPCSGSVAGQVLAAM
jgi:hypothetical protein